MTATDTVRLTDAQFIRTTSREQRRWLRERLGRYVQHLDDCATYEGFPCTCGLGALWHGLWQAGA